VPVEGRSCGHHGPLGDSGHRQRRCGIVAEIMKPQILEPEPPREIAEGARECLRAALGQHACVVIQRTGKRLEQLA
jgi:hypothetical protein